MQKQPSKMIKIISQDVELTPARKTEGAIGFDLKAPRDITLHPLIPQKISLEIKLELPKTVGGIIMARSSLAEQGMMVLGVLSIQTSGITYI